MKRAMSFQGAFKGRVLRTDTGVDVRERHLCAMNNKVCSLFICSIVAFLSCETSGPSYSQTPTTSMNTDLQIDDTWFTVEAEVDGKPVLLRGRQALHNIAESGLFNERIDISWDFKESTDYGLPTPEENELMAEVEDALTDALEVDILAALALVHTQDNVRSWMFYTRSVSEFGVRLNQALSKFDRLPISLEKNDDPDWDLYHDVLTSHDVKEQ